MRNFTYIKQQDQSDCGVACLKMILNYYDSDISFQKLREISGTNTQGTSAYGLKITLEKFDFKCDAIQSDNDIWETKNMKYPAIAHIIQNNNYMHYVVVYNIKGDNLLIADPAKGKYEISIKEFYKKWSGVLLLPFPNPSYRPIKMKKSTLLQFIPLLKEEKYSLIKVILLSSFIIFLSIFSSFYFQILIDYLVPANNYNLLTIVSIVLLSGNVIMSIFSYFRNKLMITISQNMSNKIMLRYYTHVLKLPMKFFDTRNTGDIISRFLDANKIVNALGTSSLTLVLDVGMFITVGIALFFLNKLLFLLTIMTLPLYAIAILAFVKKHDIAKDEEMSANSELNSEIIESLKGIETLKANNSINSTSERVENKFKKLIEKTFISTNLENHQDTLKEMITLISSILILWIGSYLVLNNYISLGKLVTYNALVIYFTTPLQNIINLQVILQEANVANVRLNEILEIKSEYKLDNHRKLPSTFKPDIEISNLRFNYDLLSNILEGIDLKIPYGNKIALIGKSGSGKSTLAKLLVRFYDANEGTIYFDNISINAIDIRSLREKVTYIPQSPFLLNDSLIHNLIYDMKEAISEEEIWNALELVGLKEYVDNHPRKLDMIIEENGDNISGGQKQRIALARAFLKKSDIYILDEATNAIDPILEKEILDKLMKINKTFIIITHNLHSIIKCDSLVIMENGRIENIGTHYDLMNKSKIYKKMIL